MPRPRPVTNLSWRETVASLGNIGRLVALLWDASRSLFLGTVILRLFRAVLPFPLLWIPKLILDGIISVLRHHGDPQRVWKLLLLELALVLLSEVLAQVNSVIDTLIGEEFTTYVALKLMDHAGNLDLSSFEDSTLYDKLERVRGQATGRMFLLTSLLNSAQELSTIIVLAAGLVVFSPWLLVLFAVSIVPTFIGQIHFSKLSYSALFHRTPQRRELEYLRFLGSCFETAKEIRVFGLTLHLCARYRKLAEQILIENKLLTVKRAVGALVFSLLSAAAYYGGYFVVLAKALSGAISIGTFTFLTGSFARSRASSERILTNFNEICEQALLLTDLFDFFRVTPSIRSKPNALPAPRSIRSGYEFRNVSFAYPGSERLVVRNINLRIYPSEKIALIGENGAGKTTIVKLLSRLYDPVAGQILLDGVDLRDYDVSDLRQTVSVIFQDFMRYDLFVRDNIGFGNLNSLADDSQLDIAAQKSGARPLINRFRLGYDQMLGRRFEGGIDLSGGEWQKIALARAYARDAQLFILDEPTASLDVRAEHDVFERFTELMEGRMAVLISHRFSTVRMAGRIIVLEAGEIQEEGTHEQLIRLGGRYSDLFELQAEGFRQHYHNLAASIQ